MISLALTQAVSTAAVTLGQHQIKNPTKFISGLAIRIAIVYGLGYLLARLIRHRREDVPASHESKILPLSRHNMLVGAASLIVGQLVWFIGQAVAQAAWTGTPYSLARDYISDLGAATCRQSTFPADPIYMCSPQHVAMNAAFIAMGLSVVAGIVLLRNLWPRRTLTTVGLVLVGLFGIAHIGAGFFPGDVHHQIHAIFSLGVGCGGIGIVLLGLAWWRSSRWESVVSVIVGAISFIAYGLLATASAAHQYAGIAERLSGYPVELWLAGIGVMLLAAHLRKLSVATKQGQLS